MDAHRTTPQPLQSEHSKLPEDYWLKVKTTAVKAWQLAFQIIVIVLLVANLGSLNQLYKAIGNLTEFTANAITKPQIYQGAAPNPAASASTPPAPSHKK